MGNRAGRAIPGILKLEKRSQLGFALKDISENLPGSFLIYKEEDSRILFGKQRNDTVCRVYRSGRLF